MSRLWRRQKNSGYTLIEIFVSLAVFSIAMALLASTLGFSQKLLRDTSGSTDASQKLRKVYQTLEADLRATSYAQTDTMPSSPAPGSGYPGDAFWFLSSNDPVTDTTIRGTDGQPLWQRNILYYTAIPSNHASLYGLVCAGGSNADGYDTHCPHKVLIRKIIDKSPVTIPNDESTEEELLTPGEVSAYMTAPVGFTVTAGGGNVDESRVISPSLLTFRIEKAPLAAVIPDELQCTLQATALDGLGRSVSIGTSDLEQAPQTESMEFSIFPENP